MGRKDELTVEVVDREWEMFQNVKNIGGRASCQDDPDTFRIHRLSQAGSWSEETLESYLNDLEAAEKEDRNLLTEKYARMMASTSPIEYQQIAHLLPPLDDEVTSLVEQIIEITLEWEKELAEKYPYIVQLGRPIYSIQDSPIATSFETYLRGELLTYSPKTLEHYLDNVQKQTSESINGSELVLEGVVRQYGYTSLQEAHKLIKARRQI